jgi:serine protease AprX
MKKMIPLLLLLVAAGFCNDASAQFTRYLVRFKDKGSNTHTIANPAGYLSQRAINRRTRYNIPIDSTDLPVTARYLDSIRSVPNVTILNVSKWLNQVSILTTDPAAITKINSFPFVISAAPLAARFDMIPRKNSKFGEEADGRIMADYFNYGMSAGQITIHNGNFLHNIGLRGQGMIIGVLDAGFYNYTTLKSFDSINANGQVLGTYDFVKNETSVVEDFAHGMSVLSIMAANVPGTFIGSAPKASYYLFRTEDAATEYPIEEHNWVVGAERVDSAGGDVINSSLGYTTFDNATFNHSYADMNGDTTIAAKGADLAAKKGILVVNAAGNDGNAAWHYLGTPADGDSVLAVGAVSVSGAVASFSSYGPSSDGQVKPDVASVGQGTVIQLTNNNIGTGNGTSYASPNMAGLATSLWQGFQEASNMRIIRVLRETGNKVANPDDRVGYGIPDLRKAVLILTEEFATMSGSTAGCKVTLNWTSKDMNRMRYEIERKGPADANYRKIAEQYGSATIFSNQTHQFVDDNDTAGLYSYRIRQVIDTSTNLGFYIDTVSASLSAPCVAGGSDIILVQNPTRGRFSVKLNMPESIPDMTIRIVDESGKQVYKVKQPKPAGQFIFPITSLKLASGKYYVSVYNGKNLVGTVTLVRL